MGGCSEDCLALGIRKTDNGLYGPFFIAEKRYPGGVMNNPRRENGALRRKYRGRFKAMGAPCGICGGRLGPIRYDEPSDPQHPLSFVIDEKIPVSRWEEFGYPSARAAAEDWTNLQAAHYVCNAMKSNRTEKELEEAKKRQKRTSVPSISDGDW